MAATVGDWTPDPDAVAALLPHRTGDPSGQGNAGWSDATVPSLAQVQAVIEQVAAEVAGTVGQVPDQPDSTLLDFARRVVALGAASEVELSFYPDLGIGSMTPAVSLYERYQNALKALRMAVTTVRGGEAVGDAESAAPVYSFPSMDDIPGPSSPLTNYSERF